MAISDPKNSVPQWGVKVRPLTNRASVITTRLQRIPDRCHTKKSLNLIKVASFGETIVLSVHLWCYWYSCFEHLVMSFLGLKTRVVPITYILRHLHAMDSSDPLLVQWLLICWQLVLMRLEHPAGTSKDSDKCDSIKKYWYSDMKVLQWLSMR